jgi:PAT family beta-lactamase induction signal transducer AmpG
MANQKNIPLPIATGFCTGNDTPGMASGYIQDYLGHGNFIWVSLQQFLTNFQILIFPKDLVKNRVDNSS